MPNPRRLFRLCRCFSGCHSRRESAFALAFALALIGCHPGKPATNEVTILLESSPNNLDLRQGTDAQSERVGALLFDPLVVKDDHFNLQPWLATSWTRPDPQTWIFHLHPGVHFHNGQPLEAEDVAFTLRSLTDGTLITSKSGNFALIDRIETPTPLTLTIHTRKPDNSLLFNMSDGLFGVVPRNSPKDLGLHPIGSGPFRFISATQDKDILLTRNPTYWQSPARIEHLRFNIVPDNITAALELKKHSADLASNVVTLDMVHALAQSPGLLVDTAPSSIALYMTLNVQDPKLRDKRVRQAIALAIDKPPIIQALWRGQARPAQTLLPATHWAAAQLPPIPHDPNRAAAILEQAGYNADQQGIRLHLTLKTSTDETTRLLAAVLQQQLRQAGIALTLRSSEFGTFYADITKGVFQLYILRWIGSNEDPDIFRYAYATASFPPKGGNRGRYSNPQVDALLALASAATDQPTRRAAYLQIQQIVAEDLPVIPLWYPNNEVVHTTRLQGVEPQASGTFAYLRTATVQ